MKYLVSMGPGIGDFMIAILIAARIKSNDEEAIVDVLVRSDRKRFRLFNELIKIQAVIDNAYYYSANELIHSIRSLIEMNKKQYDYGVEVNYVDNGSLSRWPLRIFKIVCKKNIGAELIHHIEYDYCCKLDASKPIYIRNANMLECIGFKRKYIEENLCRLNILKIEESVRAEIKQFSRFNFVCLMKETAPLAVKDGNKTYLKNVKSWPKLRWFELAEELVSRGINVVILGGSNDDHPNLVDGIYDMSGKTSIIESIYLISKSILLVSGDTGLMHCSGLLGVPSLTLFGPTASEDYKAYGEKSFIINGTCDKRPCFGNDNLKECNKNECMLSISVSDVLREINKVCEFEKIDNK